MKFPSIQQLYIDFTTVIKRFPLQVIIAIAATISACLYINLTAGQGDNFVHTIDYYAKFALICNLALTLTLASDLFAESQYLAGPKKTLLRVAVLIISTALYILLDPLNSIVDAYRFAMLSFAFHLLVAFAPFIGKQHLNGFWQFNKVLFLRILTSALYSFVLVAGLMIALTAINGLFSAHIRSEIYITVIFIIIIGFNTIFFLAGLPSDILALNEEHSYPKGLKIFTQFVLIPLMTLYLIILLVYEVKIILIWELPKGMVSGLILGYAVFGILSLLLIYPIRDNKDQGWIKLFSKLFYIMMVPLIILLILAVWKRVDHYGITESRYILIILALWLASITCYFLLSRKDNIKIIPVSLCILALVSCYGPQSAIAVSKQSQLSRLKSLLHAKQKKDISERMSIVRYLVETHGLRTLQPLTDANLKNIETKIEKKEKNKYSRKEDKIDTALALLHIKNDKKAYRERQRVTYINDKNEILQVTGYDYVIDMRSYEPEPLNFNGHTIRSERNNKDGKLTLVVDKKNVLTIDLNQVYKNLNSLQQKGKLKSRGTDDEYYFPADQFQFGVQSGGYLFTIIITKAFVYSDEDDYNIYPGWNSLESYVLIKKI